MSMKNMWNNTKGFFKPKNPAITMLTVYASAKADLNNTKKDSN